MALRIAIVVHGRFHAFDLARELIRQGTEVTLLTNYPKWMTRRYGVPSSRVVSCPSHRLASQIIHRTVGRTGQDFFEPLLHRWFSTWASRVLAPMELDAIHSFSGVSEEILLSFPRHKPLRSLIRGSAHIRAQARLLGEEQRRCGCRFAQPSRWMIHREMREYELADLVIVLSSFAAKTFEEEGFSHERLQVLPLGSELRRFRPPGTVVEERCRRILTGGRLTVLTVGSFTYQKGMYDLARVARCLGGRMRFRFVGDCPAETRRLQRECRDVIEFVPRQPQFALARQYQEGDLFLFPTIQDGYATVLAQAHAAGLPLLTTTNCAGPDLVSEGVTGWVLPIRDPESIINRLQWCNGHRQELAAVVQNTFVNFQPRDWAQVASELQAIYEAALGRPRELCGIHS